MSTKVLWIARKKFQETVSIVRRKKGGDQWKRVRFLVFDTPGFDGPVENRFRVVNDECQYPGLVDLLFRCLLG